MEPRVPRHRYADPLDQIWLGAAARLGFRVERTGDAYASTDGKRTILVGTRETLDPDDCLAQMILHELCHALTEGPGAEDKLDWGLDNQTDRDTGREYACLRLQAALTAPHGLRGVLAPTTDWRAYYDALPSDPLAPRRDPAAVAARLALVRARRAPWAPALDEALAASARVVAACAPFAAPGDLVGTFVAPPAPHPTGLDGAVEPGTTCAGCAWRVDHRSGSRCRQAGVRVDPAWPGCARWEPALDCQECGACCRDAYHSVTVTRRDPVVKRHPELIVAQDTYLEIARRGDRCAALAGDDGPAGRYACTIYQDRPRPCRGFERGSDNCLDARRRVGLSL